MSRRQEIRARRLKAQQRQRMTWIGIIAAFAIVVAAILIIPGLSRQATGEVVVPTSAAYPQANGTALGDPDAPVKVDLFSDFLCSHCKDFSRDEEPGIIKDYVDTGKVYLVYHSFRVIAPESDNGAMAALCAADQGRFWEYKDIVFENVGVTPNPMSNATLEAYAKALGLDSSQFDKCLTGGKYRQKIKEEQALGVQRGITGTPGFLINNSKVVDRSQLRVAIEQALAASGN